MVGLPRKSTFKIKKILDDSDDVSPDVNEDIVKDKSEDIVNAKIQNTSDKSQKVKVSSNITLNPTETPEERKERIHAERMKNLAKAQERGKEVMAQRKIEREKMKEDLKGDRKKLLEMKRELERQKIATKWANLEKEKAKIEKVIKRSIKIAPAPVQRLDDDSEEDYEEEEVKPKMRRTKPIRRRMEESEEEEDPMPLPRLTRSYEQSHPKPIPQPQIILQDPISTLTQAQIRDDLRKMQMEMMAKQLWGNI